ncbi:MULTISPECIES: DUF2730 family protein [Alcaligenaceae]|uniref:DUF2730 domain-containing protein n=1 Tax=Achromobacter pulmonis TaxID=1389932 RepID=A0A2N8K863_9BURK|nr:MULTISPECIES: DUF2730 family protein [Alcaligenaceae]KXA72505.1 hypothetical protein AXA74_12800 [Bordetella hinzii LMG 13501]PND29641.1 DUF2730 domain-containing protein [Achromobacter pulmonis]TFL14897.1 DUF2730 family protein [Pusillimonas caeni]VEH25224.1 Protein of uncharacterised function (DUF2730) [Bordetella hinzii]
MEGVDWGAARLFWDVLQTGITAAIAVYVWWTGRSRATTDAIDRVDDRVTQVQQRLDRVEHTLESRPGYADLDALRAEVAQTNRKLAEVSAQLVGTTNLLNRLHDYLLQERREK